MTQANQSANAQQAAPSTQINQGGVVAQTAQLSQSYVVVELDNNGKLVSVHYHQYTMSQADAIKMANSLKSKKPGSTYHVIPKADVDSKDTDSVRMYAEVYHLHPPATKEKVEAVQVYSC